MIYLLKLISLYAVGCIIFSFIYSSAFFIYDKYMKKVHHIQPYKKPQYKYLFDEDRNKYKYKRVKGNFFYIYIKVGIDDI